MKKFKITILLLLVAAVTSALCACGNKKEESCAHNYVDGVCTICSEACTHIYSEGVCAACKMPCEHDYENSVCTICGTACTHSYDNGTCTACGKVCEHDYTDGKCSVCGVNCTHDYENSVCTVCGTACTHSYDNGTCTACGKVCEHDYTDGKCTVCGVNCTHDYENSVCTVCGMACKHNYKKDTCTLCGNVCTHNYEDGVCTECNTPCQHEYEDGVCTKCSTACTHEYEEGICTVCGYEDLTWMPEDGFASKYDDIVKKYKYLVQYKSLYEVLPSKKPSDPEYVNILREVADQYDPTKKMGYAYKDINSDGYVELLLMESDCHIHAIFTVIDRQPVHVHTFQQGMGYLHTDGTVFYNVKASDADGQILLEYHITKLVGDKLEGFCYGWYDQDESFATEDDEVYFDSNPDGTRREITYEEYKVYRDHRYAYYWDYPTRLTKLVGLIFNNALVDTDDAVYTANFSTYNAIIKTFGIMHSDVAGGKYQRSYWTGGRYDKSMTFRSDEDYYLYNRLIGACVLVQNNSKAVFGYALKDLNNDGVDELILLESKYYVLAIFTEVDGKPVLLDTFTDTRSAIIDADGRIHVKQKQLPGHKKDVEYFIYEVSGSQLVCTLAIGVKYDTADVQNKWYKIENGTATDVTEAEWTELYNLNFADNLDIDKYYEYTQANAGLEFVSVS